MNLILQAIKSLLRKVENAVSQTVTDLGGLKKQINTLNNILFSVRGTVQDALTAADVAMANAATAQTTADNAMGVAEDAKTTAATAQSSADNAKNLALDAQNYAEKARKEAKSGSYSDYYSSSQYHTMEPTQESQLEVGQTTTLKTYLSSFTTMLGMSLGARGRFGFVYYQDSGDSALFSVVLTKVSDDYLEGGAWADLGVSHPHYYKFHIGLDSTNSSYCRLI